MRQHGKKLVLAAIGFGELCIHALQFVPALTQQRARTSAFFGRTLASRYVAAYFRCTDHAAVSIVDRRDRQRDVDSAAVFGDANRLEMLDSLTEPYAPQNVIFFLVAFGRNNQGHRLADRFVGRIAEQALRSRVPRGNDPVERLADDCVVGRGNDCSQQGGRMLGITLVLRRRIPHERAAQKGKDAVLALLCAEWGHI